MDTASIIREFLDENSIAAARSVEIAYKYHAELETGCRLTGCEIIMRAVGEDVFVRVELPISVMTKETRGVVKYLADLNKKRVEEGKQGYFDLDYVAGKIIFGIRVRQPITPDILKDVAHYCVDQIEYESDDLIKVVCEECEAVLQEEEAARQRMERENREPSMFALLMRRLKKAVMDKLDPDAIRKNARFGLPGAAPAGEEIPEYNEPDEVKDEPAAAEPAQAEPIQPEAEEAPSGEEEPDFKDLLKTLSLDAEEETEEESEEAAAQEPAEDENAAEDPIEEDTADEEAAIEEAEEAPAESEKEEDKE